MSCSSPKSPASKVNLLEFRILRGLASERNLTLCYASVIRGGGEVKQGFPKDDFLSKLRCVMMNDRLPLNVQTFEGFITSSFVVKLRCERISSESLKKLRHRHILGATIVCMCRTRPMLHDCFLHSTQSGTARLLRFNIISIFKTFL